MSHYSPSVASWARSVARETEAISQAPEPLGPHPPTSRYAPSVQSRSSERYAGSVRAPASQYVVRSDERPPRSRAPSPPPSYTESERYRRQMVPYVDPLRDGASQGGRERTSAIQDRSNLSTSNHSRYSSGRSLPTIHPDDSATNYPDREQKRRNSQMGMVMATVPECGTPSASSRGGVERRRGGSSYRSGDGTSFSVSRSASASYSKVTSVDSYGTTQIVEELSIKNRRGSGARRVKERGDHDGPRVDRLASFMRGKPVYE